MTVKQRSELCLLENTWLLCFRHKILLFSGKPLHVCLFYTLLIEINPSIFARQIPAKLTLFRSNTLLPRDSYTDYRKMLAVINTIPWYLFCHIAQKYDKRDIIPCITRVCITLMILFMKNRFDTFCRNKNE